MSLLEARSSPVDIRSRVLVGGNDMDIHVAGEPQEVVSNGCPQQFVESSSVGVANNNMRHILLMRHLQQSFGNRLRLDALNCRAKVFRETQILLQRVATLGRR